ncbi:MAG: hypothetical protein RL885_12845 [Planctomycetota bacterium]
MAVGTVQPVLSFHITVNRQFPAQGERGGVPVPTHILDALKEYFVNHPVEKVADTVEQNKKLYNALKSAFSAVMVDSKWTLESQYDPSRTMPGVPDWVYDAGDGIHVRLMYEDQKERTYTMATTPLVVGHWISIQAP